MFLRLKILYQRIISWFNTVKLSRRIAQVDSFLVDNCYVFMPMYNFYMSIGIFEPNSEGINGYTKKEDNFHIFVTEYSGSSETFTIIISDGIKHNTSEINWSDVTGMAIRGRIENMKNDIVVDDFFSSISKTHLRNLKFSRVNNPKNWNVESSKEPQLH